MQKPHWTAPFSRNAALQRASAGRLFSQALDRDDLAAVGLDRQHEARVDDAVVEPDRARAALAHEAALLGAGQAQVVAQRVEQRVVLLDVDRPRPAR